MDCLEAEGFSAILARNGRQALDVLSATQPRLIVLDLMMPVMDGFAFLRQLARLPTPHPPVVATSAFQAYLDAAPGEGATAVIAKPFSIEAFVGLVEGVLDGRKPPEPRSSVARAQDELARMNEVFALKLDEPAPTAAMDTFVRRAADIFDVPICLVSIITEDRQYWHSFCGLPPDLELARGTPRRDSFCTHAVAAQAALVVQDARESPIFARNPLVLDRGLRFYAGVPLRSRFGRALGTLCLLDFRSRTFTAFDLELLGVLARRVVAELEWRERHRSPEAPDAAFRYLTWLDEELDLLGREAFTQALCVASWRAAERRTPLSLGVISVAPEHLEDTTKRLEQAFPRGLLGRLGMSRVGVLAFDEPMESLRRQLEAAVALGGSHQVTDVPHMCEGADQLLSMVEAALGRQGLAPTRP